MNQPHVQCQKRLHEILRSHLALFEKGVSEYDLITLLKSPPHTLFDENALSDSLLLFQTHFVLFHTLYKLRAEWRSKNIGELDIIASNIQLLPISQQGRSTDLQAADPLAEYYLDWQNLVCTEQEDVESLLVSFWERILGSATNDYLGTKIKGIHSQSAIEQAIQTLEFSDVDITNLSLAQIKSQYRTLQHRYHPDKGGTIEKAQLILNAYEILCESIDS
jgi:hypothetical protein